MGINGTHVIISSWHAWRMFDIAQQAEAFRVSGAAQRWSEKVQSELRKHGKRPLAEKAIATKRDSYGWKSL